MDNYLLTYKYYPLSLIPPTRKIFKIDFYLPSVPDPLQELLSSQTPQRKDCVPVSHIL